jgi:hypothetical protein
MVMVMEVLLPSQLLLFELLFMLLGLGWHCDKHDMVGHIPCRAHKVFWPQQVAQHDTVS